MPEPPTQADNPVREVHKKIVDAADQYHERADPSHAVQGVKEPRHRFDEEQFHGWLSKHLGSAQLASGREVGTGVAANTSSAPRIGGVPWRLASRTT